MLKSEMEKEIILQKILIYIDLYRGLILDTVAVELEETPKWRHIRSTLLKLLGDRGLEGKIKELYESKPLSI